jgi:acid phosphatase (class A)
MYTNTRKLFLTAAIAVCSVHAFAAETVAPNTSANSPSAGQVMSRPAPQGYLTSAQVPSSAALVPPPPVAGSAAMARDEEANRNILSLNGSPRWQMAMNDAVLTFPTVAQTFSCALNLPVSDAQTPKLMALLRKTLIDTGRATSEAKRLYQRARPFTVNGKPTCTPNSEEGLRRDGSYPSGHTSIGWAFGLVLSEVAPEQANAVLARGRAFGQSRMVCNVHWQSDVEQGQMVGAAVVARLHAEPAFRADVAAAQAEVAALRLKGEKSSGACDVESETMKTSK